MTAGKVPTAREERAVVSAAVDKRPPFPDDDGADNELRRHSGSARISAS